MDRLITLVRDLLELTTLEGGEAHREQIALEELVRDLLKQVAPRFERQDIRLLSDLPTGTVPVFGSQFQLRQVLHNLLDNSLKHTSPGGLGKGISPGGGRDSGNEN